MLIPLENGDFVPHTELRVPQKKKKQPTTDIANWWAVRAKSPNWDLFPFKPFFNNAKHLKK